MNQNVKLVIIIVVILTTSFIYNKTRPEKKSIKLKKEMIFSSSDEMKKLNVNNAEIENYLKVGITLSIAKKIFEYKEIVGRVENLKDLSRIAGIGDKTVEKLSKKIEIRDGGNLNELKINSASTKMLKYYGLTKKEIKKIEIYKEKNDVIYSNIEMMKILGEERYRIYEDIITYN
ncbi:MAG: helix-hairpin-helix domain-containing protein [Psychrilyobacter sp.]|uniref:ComEA family DNA-binding protein n=1 Tax=Psychrilyobacter sp. TaxID=2586924 RepID=UPI003C73929E